MSYSVPIPGGERKMVSAIKKMLVSVFEQGDLSDFTQLFQDTTQFEGFLVDHATGVEELTEAITAVLSLIDGAHVAFGTTIEQDAWICVIVQVMAQSATTGAPVMLGGNIIAHSDGSKINAVYCVFDWIRFFEGLDLMPPSSALACVTGQKLVVS
ncbi:MAG: hypothetical protein AAGD04_01905 [Pseudomonadota bacterium]